MFETICDTVPTDTGMPARVGRLDILRHVLDGTLYDNLPYQFHEERNGAGEYVPLRMRRPSVRYRLCRIVVEDSVALLFSAAHFPTVECADSGLAHSLADIICETGLNEIMIDAAIRGLVGSVAILMRVLRGRIFFSVMESLYLTPVWSVVAPDTLSRVTERYKVTGADLAAQGYENVDPGTVYWFQRVWDDISETWYLPWAVHDPAGQPIRDNARSVTHGLGFVPIVWIRNLPGGDGVDGACTFRGAIETNIEIDYQLSQAGRGLKYSSDPTLLIKEPATCDSEIVKGAGNALVVSEKGDAKLLEIGGTACEAVISYVRTLREFALESLHGNRANADRLTVAQSGRALELMNQGLIWLADNLRISYGLSGILPLMKMVVCASQVFPLTVMGKTLPALDSTQRLNLRWPRWYPLSADDRLKEAQAVATLTNAGQLSRETAVKTIATSHSIADVEAELNAIDQDVPSRVFSMDNFARCFAFTLGAEGGYTDNSADPGNWTGGEVGHGVLRGTKFGISAAAYPQLDIGNLSQALAEEIYRRDFWAPLQGEALPLPVALVAFDAAVNAGRRRAITWLQQAAGLEPDGVLGPGTLAALTKGDAVQLAREALVRRLDFSSRLPTWSNFGLGWSRRLIALAGELAV